MDERERLRRVRRAAVRSTVARSTFVAEVRAAAAEGISLRKIATAAGLSHVTIHTIVRKGDSQHG